MIAPMYWTALTLEKREVMAYTKCFIKICRKSCEHHCVLEVQSYEKKYLKYIHRTRVVQQLKIRHKIYALPLCTKEPPEFKWVLKFMKWTCLPDGNCLDFMTQYTPLSGPDTVHLFHSLYCLLVWRIQSLASVGAFLITCVCIQDSPPFLIHSQIRYSLYQSSYKPESTIGII